MKLEIIGRRDLFDIAASSPIPIVNASPIQLLFLQAVPARPRTLPRGATRLALTTTVANTLLKESSGSSVGWVDMEMIMPEADLWPGFGARLAVKLPTASQTRGLDSGHADFGAGLLIEKHLGNLGAFLNADVIFPGDIDNDTAINTHTFCQAMLGLSYSLTAKISVSVQAAWTSRPFSGTGLSMLDRRIVDLLLGLTYLRDDGIFFQAGTQEDILDSVDAGTDITYF